MSARGIVRIGVSGWRYPPWRGAFYPPGLAQKDELAFAARALPTIELNGSFYSLQRPSSWQAWHDATPARFVFSVKGPRYITHLLRLRDAAAPLANFFASGLANLGTKLGPILWQLPPTFAFEPALVGAFLALLPRDTVAAAELAHRHDGKVKGRVALDWGPQKRALRHALEARHPSFADPSLIALLRRHKVAWVVADTGGRWPEFDDVTASFVYVRLHGATDLYRSRYADHALRQWAARIERWRDGGEPARARRIGGAAPPRTSRDVFCYFDNTDKVHAPSNAGRLLEMLGLGGAGAAAPRARKRAQPA
jgi:uncharacterized protein YecE (DUF72 family)